MGIVAAFRELDAIVDAIEELKNQKITDFTVYTPTPRHEIEEIVYRGRPCALALAAVTRHRRAGCRTRPRADSGSARAACRRRRG